MKHLSIISMTIALIPTQVSAEVPQRKSGVRVVPSRLPQKDAIEAAALFDLSFKNGKIVDECDMGAGGPDLKDLNGDGITEAIFYDGMCLGGNAGFVGIAARKAGGGWKIIFADQGVLEMLKTKRGGWPDIRIGKPGMDAPPVYHWIGNRYDYTTGNPDDAPIASRNRSPSTAVVAPVVRMAPTPITNYADPSINICTLKSANTGCDFIVGPNFTNYADPACENRDLPIFTCADNAITLAEAKGVSGFYLIYFKQGIPGNIGNGKIPLDRTYTAAYLEKNSKSKWRLKKGVVYTAPISDCPNYGLSSLQTRGIDGLPQPVMVARYVKCDIVNNGEYTFRDPVLTGPPPFIRSNDRNAYMPTPVQAEAPTASPVWSLGRARYLVERDRQCAPQESLGTSYCFGEAMQWLQRHPDKQAIDVVAMDTSWALGSMIPHNSGQGWDIYRVARNGDGFTAGKQRHYATQVRIPQGCLYAGVAAQAWFITAARGRKVAVESARYLCQSWTQSPLYARYLDAGDLDAQREDIALNLSPALAGRQGASTTSHAPPSSPPVYRRSTTPSADFGGPMLRNGWQSGTGAVIYGSPKDTTGADCLDQTQVQIYMARRGVMPQNACSTVVRKPTKRK